MNRLSLSKRVHILQLLVEGNSMRTIARMVGCSTNSVAKALGEAGAASAEFQNHTLRNITCQRIECSEIQSFSYARERNVPEALQGVFGVGGIYTLTAIDVETKLVLSWFVGTRGAQSARVLKEDLESRVNSRLQHTTDGHKICLEPTKDTFQGNSNSEIGAEDTNLSNRHRHLGIQMHIRQFMRSTSTFSKRLSNLMNAVSLHIAYYNFVQVHKTLGFTPAMMAGVADHVWAIEEIAKLIELAPEKRTP